MDVGKITEMAESLIHEGQSLLSTEWANDRLGQFTIANPTHYVDLEKHSKWHSNCQLFLDLLGPLGRTWENIRSATGNTMVSTKSVLGSLRSILEATNNGWLDSYHDVVLAEAFSNLLDQAEYLHSRGYDIASGVISRAVLEEHLRAISERHKIEIAKSRPTLNDYNSELYKNGVFDKILFKRIDYLTSIGNAAAHCNDPLPSHDSILELLNGVIDVVSRLPLSTT